MRAPRVSAVSVEDEVGDKLAHRGRDLEPVPAETRCDDQTLQVGSADDRVPVRGDVITARVAATDRRVGEAGEASADLVDGEVDECVGGTVQIVVGIRLFDVGQVAVAEQNVAADLGPDVLHRDQFGDGGNRANVDTRRGQRLRGHARVAVAAAGLPAERLEWRQVRERPHAGNLGPVDLLGLHTDRALRGKAFAEGLDVGFTDTDNISGLPEADVGAEYLLGVLEDFESDGGHGGKRRDTVVATHDATGFA